MMQDVATANSDIAAFASGFGIALRERPESDQNFDQVMQDQKDKLAKQQSGKKKPVEQTFSSQVYLSDKAKDSEPHESVKATKPETVDVYQDNASKNAKAIDNEKAKLETKVSQQTSSISPEQELTASKNNELALEALQKQVQPTVINDELLPESKKEKSTMADLALSLSENQSNAELKASPLDTLENNDVVAEEWLALVENYQKFADIALATKKLPVEEQAVSLDLEKVLPENFDKGLLKQIAENQLIYKSDNTPKAADIEPQVVDTKVTGNASHKTNQVDVDKANIAILVQQTLEQLNADPGSAEIANQLTKHQTAELLLSDPKVSKGVQSALENVMQNTAVEAKVDKEVLKENTALLHTLLTNNQTSTSKDISTAAVALDAQEIKMSNLPKSNQGIAEEIQSAVIPPEVVASGKLANDIQIEADVSQSIALLNEPVLDKNLQGNAKVASDINLLLGLPDKTLTKVLEHIAGRVIPSNSAPDAVNLEQDLGKQIVVPKAADFAVATDNQTKEFISVLKSGIEEFKQQLAQGREPGLDLKSLITDALAKSNDSVMGKTSVNVQQISQSISQVLDFAQSINRAIEHHQEQTYSAVQRDVAQIQGEQSKSLQFNQFEAKFEKAVNITKPEGHQQLAEKVRWMVNTKNLVADIRLDPAELGSVHVKVAMSGESATVNFVVQSQHARDAMDNATPRLREMLAEKGIELGQSTVEQESKGQGEGELSQHSGHNRGGDPELELSEQTIAQQPIVNGALGGIDYFV